MIGAGTQNEREPVGDDMSLESFRSARAGGAKIAEQGERDSSDLHSFVSGQKPRQTPAGASTQGRDDDFCDWQEPVPTVETEHQTRSRWRSEIMGVGNVAWKREELESAVTSTCILERTLLADVAAEAPLIRTRSDDVVMEETLRKMGDQSLAHLRELEKTGPELDKLLDTVRLFTLPTSGRAFAAVSGRASAVQTFLDIGEQQKKKCRARGTWARYRGPMKKVRAYLHAAISADGREWCAETLAEHPEYVRSVAGWAYATTNTASAVESRILALRLCLRFNDVEVADDFTTKAVREVSKRERSKAPHRRAAITREEVMQIIKKWKSKATPVKRMMACVVGIGFQCLLRWADMALIHIQGIYWYDDGCVFALPRRKNAQHKPELVAFADSGGPGSLFKVLREHCAHVAGRAMPVRGRCDDIDRFVFRNIEKPAGASGHNWNGKRSDVLEMKSRRPIGRSGYKKYLVRFKQALKDCCGMTAEAVKEFGMHSMRVGGDTWLFENGMTDAVRQRMGGWASAFSEKTYIRTLVAERIDTCRAMGL